MPLILSKNPNPNIAIYVWKLTEKLEELQPLLTLNESEKRYLAKVSNNKRKREWIVVRVLLRQIFKKKINIAYTKHGKPYLSDISEKNISISHSKNYVAIILSNNTVKIGIDIESIAERIEKIVHKFLTPSEVSWADSQEIMTICWGAKEAIFKIYETALDFHDILIKPFSLADLFLEATVTKNSQQQIFKVFFEKIENDRLTYTFL